MTENETKVVEVPLALIERVAEYNHDDAMHNSGTAFVNLSRGNATFLTVGAGEHYVNSDGSSAPGPARVTAAGLLRENRGEEATMYGIYPSYNQQRNSYREAVVGTAGVAEPSEWWTEERVEDFRQHWEDVVMVNWRSEVRRYADGREIEHNGTRYRITVTEEDSR
jgi:hypothetical protein